MAGPTFPYASPAMSLDPALRSRIESLLQANRVVLFMKGQPGAPQCGFSAKASGVLEDLGVDYAHVNVLADAEIREGIKAFGNWPTIPQLYIEGELVGGSDIIEQMASSGELHAALGVAPPDRTPPAITITAAAQAVPDAPTLVAATANTGCPATGMRPTSCHVSVSTTSTSCRPMAGR